MIISWLSTYICKKHDREVTIVDIQSEAAHLTTAMGELSQEVSKVKKERKAIHLLLDEALKGLRKK